MGCRDFCPDVDIALTAGLPAHVDSSRCNLNKLTQFCQLDACLDGYLVSANGTGLVSCTSGQDGAYFVYEPGPVPLLCVPAPVEVTASASDSVLLLSSNEALAGEIFTFTVELRNNVSHPSIGIAPDSSLVAVRSIVSFSLSFVCFAGCINSHCLSVSAIFRRRHRFPLAKISLAIYGLTWLTKTECLCAPFQRSHLHTAGRVICGRFSYRQSHSLAVTGFVCSFKIARFHHSSTPL